MRYEPITPALRERVNDFLRAHWFTTDMVLRGAVIDMTRAEGIVALDDADALVGLLTYRADGDTCEILSLDSVRPGKGIGTALIERVQALATARGCRRLVVITTNDNIEAIRFYRRRGFDLVRLYRGALDASRRLKPEIPLIGEHGIPLRHELEFERALPTPADVYGNAPSSI